MEVVCLQPLNGGHNIEGFIDYVCVWGGGGGGGRGGEEEEEARSVMTIHQVAHII